MSFSIDLWNGFDIIKSSFSLNYKRVKQILDILTLYSSVQKEYYKSLENLFKESKEIKEKDIQRSNSLLDDSLYLLIFSFRAESDKIKNHYNNINKNITEIRDKLEKIKLQITPFFAENLQNRESFNRVLNNLILKYEGYNKSCKDLCYFLAEAYAHQIIEEKKNNKSNDKDKEYMDNKISKDEKMKEKIISYKEMINKNFAFYLNNNILKDNKKEYFTKKILENKKEYIKCISESDKEREKFNKITEDLLSNLQKQYKNLIFLFQNAFHNYVKDKVKSINDIIEIIKSNDNQIYSKINYKNLTYDFIIKNATKEFPMNKLEFIPYKININKINQKLDKFNELNGEDHKRIIKEIKKDIDNSKINKYENEFLRQSFINRNISGKIKRINKIRRSGSSGMLDIKNKGKSNFKNNEDNNITEVNKINENPINNIKVSKNKDDIEISKENNKKSNLNFIKDFVIKLICPRRKKKRYII